MFSIKTQFSLTHVKLLPFQIQLQQTSQFDTSGWIARNGKAVCGGLMCCVRVCGS